MITGVFATESPHSQTAARAI